MDKERLFRLWAKIAAIVCLFLTIDQAYGIFRNYKIAAYLDIYFYIYLIVKVLPLLLLVIPLLYFGFRKKS